MLTAQIKKALDSTEGADYIFTISVQGHGDYPTTMPEGFIPGITVSGFFDEEEQVQFEYYVNQIHEMVHFIGELTNMLSRRNEETVLVMYGRIIFQHLISLMILWRMVIYTRQSILYGLIMV